MSVIGAIAVLKVQPGKEDAFEAAFKELRDKVQANEEGCLLYDLFRDKKNSDTYYVQEQYKDEGALDAHGKTEYFQAFAGRAPEFLADTPKIHMLSKVE